MELTEEKIKAVRKQLRAGIPQGEINNELLAEGYSADDLEKIFTPHRPDMRSWYLVFAILFLLIGIYNLMANLNFIFLVFSGAMFLVYYFEHKRIRKNSA